MVAVLIFVVAVAALGQFAFYYWRALLLTVASEPVSERLGLACGSHGPAVPSDFSALLALYGICPKLRKEGRGIGSVTVYYRFLAALKSLLGRVFPDVSLWADREMTTCASYLAVLVDQRLQRNFVYAAEIRSL